MFSHSSWARPALTTTGVLTGVALLYAVLFLDSWQAD